MSLAERLSDFLPGVPDSFRALGGPGSGNFGHAGRPGLVGGSAPVVYHGTSRENLESIRKNGLRPSPEGNPLNFHQNEWASRDYAGETGVLFRVREDLLPEDVKKDALTQRMWTSTVVPPAAIEMEVDGKWVPLVDAVPLSGKNADAEKALDRLEEEYGELIPYAELFSSYDENQEAVAIYNNGIDQSRPGEIETLDPKSLVATQEDLGTAGLRHYLAGTGRSADENPVAIRYGGKTYLIDGHHRAAAAILQGKSLKVEVYDAEKLLPEMFGRALGGPGSGNFGHAGRPGQVGGSAPQDLSPEDRAALDSYGFARTGRAINNMLREGEIDGFAREQRIVKTLDRLMAPGEPLTVYRAMPAHAVQHLTPGAIFVDKGFTSTTKEQAAAAQFLGRFSDGDDKLLAVIQVPAEAPRLDTTKYTRSSSAFTVENNEVILPRDTAFQIVSTDPLEMKVTPYVDDKGSSWSPMSNSVLKEMLDTHQERSPAVKVLLKELKRRAKKGDVHAKQVHDETVTRLRNFRAAKAPEKPSIKFNKINKRAAKWARAHAAELVTDISETSRKRIKQAVAKLLEGENYNTVVSLIEKAVGDDDRAMLIAHHETMTAVSAGQREAWQEAQTEGLLPDNMKRVWIITPVNACPDCEALDGAVADIDGFYPDGSVGPPRHPRCRCTEGLI